RLLPLARFVYHAAYHPDLASLPTRRSSDLNGRQYALEGGCLPRAGVLLPAHLGGYKAGNALDGEHGAAGTVLIFQFIHGKAAARSEEHTSELQSRENLVCRLLREKTSAEET